MFIILAKSFASAKLSIKASKTVREWYFFQSIFLGLLSLPSKSSSNGSLQGCSIFQRKTLIYLSKGKSFKNLYIWFSSLKPFVFPLYSANMDANSLSSKSWTFSCTTLNLISSFSNQDLTLVKCSGEIIISAFKPENASVQKSRFFSDPYFFKRSDLSSVSSSVLSTYHIGKMMIILHLN